MNPTVRFWMCMGVYGGLLNATLYVSFAHMLNLTQAVVVPAFCAGCAKVASR